MVRTPACRVGGRGFESLRPRPVSGIAKPALMSGLFAFKTSISFVLHLLANSDIVDNEKLVTTLREIMCEHKSKGELIRETAKKLVLDYMITDRDCAPDGKGRKQAEIARNCGLVFCDYDNVSSSQQQFWTVAILRELEQEGKVIRKYDRGPWILK